MQYERQKVSFLNARGRLLGDRKEVKIRTFSRGAKSDLDM